MEHERFDPELDDLLQDIHRLIDEDGLPAEALSDEEFDIRSYCRASGTLAGFKQCLNVLGYDIKNDKVVKIEEK